MRISCFFADNYGCGWLRIMLPYSFIKKLGHDVFASDSYAWDRETLRPQQDPEIVVIQRPGNVPMEVMIEGCKRHNIPLVVELDDLLWDIPTWNPSYWAWFTKKDLKEYVPKTGTKVNLGGRQTVIDAETRLVDKNNNNLQVLKKFIASADACTVSTEFLANIIRERWKGKPVFVNLNSLDLEKWPEIDHRTRWEQTQTVTFGWGGSFTHSKDLEPLKGVIGPTLAQYPYTRMFFYGSTGDPMSSLAAGFPPERVEQTGWIDADKVQESTQKLDVGFACVIPHKFNFSKSSIKAIEHGAVNVPTIASDKTCYNDFIQHGINGWLCKTPRDWIRAIEVLATDHAKRIEMGIQARRTVEEKFNVKKNAPKLADFLQEVIDRKRLQTEKRVVMVK